MLVLAAITHQVVQHENAWSQIFGKQALNVFWDALVEMDLFALHVFETTLGFTVPIHDPSNGPIKSTGSRSHQLSSKRRFFALAGPRHIDAARRFKIGIIVRRSHHLQMNRQVHMSAFLIHNRNKYNVELVFWTHYIARNSREMSLEKVFVE